MVARGDHAVTGGQEAGDAPEATVIQGATEDVCWLDPKDRHPPQEATMGMQPGGRWTPPALCGPADR